MDPLHPTTGIRVLLDRESVAPDLSQAEYKAAVFTVSEVFAYRAVLDMEGGAELLAQDGPAEEDAHSTLEKIARSTARAAKRKREEGLPPWPTRVLRWRGPK